MKTNLFSFGKSQLSSERVTSDVLVSKTVFQIQKSNQRIGSETVLVGHLKLPVLARYLRINPNNFRKDGSIRAEVFGCHMTDNRNKRKYKQWRVSSYSPDSYEGGV